MNKRKEVMVIIGFMILLISVSFISACIKFPEIDTKICSVVFDGSNYKNSSAVLDKLNSKKSACGFSEEDIVILKNYVLNGYSVKEQTAAEYAAFFNEAKLQNNKSGCGDYYRAVYYNKTWTGYIKDIKSKDENGTACPQPNCVGASAIIFWNSLPAAKPNVTAVQVKKIETLKDYLASINYSCEWDNDCVIKDIRNCCGANPKCVNKNSVFNSSPLPELCKKESEGGVSMCGYENINSCKCVNKWCRGFASAETCPAVNAPSCIAELVSQGVDEKGCEKTPKCMKTLSNGRNAEIKIMPETASARAIERLGELGFSVTLKEVGSGDGIKPVYEVSAEKEGKIFGFIKKKGKFSVDVDAETGEVLSVRKPWWNFLAF